MNMPQQNLTKWRASFNINPPLHFREVKNLTNIKIIKEVDAPDAKATTLEITIGQSTEELAINSARQIANRCADYLTFLKGFPVEITLLSITDLSSLKPATQFIYPTLIKDRLDANHDVDLSAKLISKILDGNELKLCIELYHYHEALKSDDIAVKIEELFQILEHEYDKKMTPPSKNMGYSVMPSFIPNAKINVCVSF